MTDASPRPVNDHLTSGLATNRVFIMNRSYLVALMIALGSNVTLVAAQDAKSRQQVRSELADARRTGNIVAFGDSGLSLRELYPGRYESLPQASSVTRAQVYAELQRAQRNGEIPLSDTGLIEYQTLSTAFPKRKAVNGKTKQEVRAELKEAIRTGDILVDGESGLTLREMYPRRYIEATGPVEGD